MYWFDLIWILCVLHSTWALDYANIYRCEIFLLTYAFDINIAVGNQTKSYYTHVPYISYLVLKVYSLRFRESKSIRSDGFVIVWLSHHFNTSMYTIFIWRRRPFPFCYPETVIKIEWNVLVCVCPYPSTDDVCLCVSLFLESVSIDFASPFFCSKKFPTQKRIAWKLNDRKNAALKLNATHTYIGLRPPILRFAIHFIYW